MTEKASSTMVIRNLYRSLLRHVGHRSIQEVPLGLSKQSLEFESKYVMDIPNLILKPSSSDPKKNRIDIQSLGQMKNAIKFAFRRPGGTNEDVDAGFEALRVINEFLNDFRQAKATHDSNQDPEVLKLCSYMTGHIIEHRTLKVRGVVTGWVFHPPSTEQNLLVLWDQNDLLRSMSSPTGKKANIEPLLPASKAQLLQDPRLFAITNQQLQSNFLGYHPVLRRYLPSLNLSYLFPADIPFSERISSHRKYLERTEDKYQSILYDHFSAFVKPLYEQIEKRLWNEYFPILKVDKDRSRLTQEQAPTVALQTLEMSTISFEKVVKQMQSLKELSAAMIPVSPQIPTDNLSSLLTWEQRYYRRTERVLWFLSVLIDLHTFLSKYLIEKYDTIHEDTTLIHRLFIDRSDSAEWRITSRPVALPSTFNDLFKRYSTPLPRYRSGDFVLNKSNNKSGIILSVETKPREPLYFLSKEYSADQPYYRLLPEPGTIDASEVSDKAKLATHPCVYVPEGKLTLLDHTSPHYQIFKDHYPFLTMDTTDQSKLEALSKKLLTQRLSSKESNELDFFQLIQLLQIRSNRSQIPLPERIDSSSQDVQVTFTPSSLSFPQRIDCFQLELKQVLFQAIVRLPTDLATEVYAKLSPAELLSIFPETSICATPTSLQQFLYPMLKTATNSEIVNLVERTTNYAAARYPVISRENSSTSFTSTINDDKDRMMMMAPYLIGLSLVRFEAQRMNTAGTVSILQSLMDYYEKYRGTELVVRHGWSTGFELLSVDVYIQTILTRLRSVPYPSEEFMNMVTELERNLERYPDHPGLISCLASLYEQTGRVKAANRYYQRCIELYPFYRGLATTIQFLPQENDPTTTNSDPN